MALSEKFIDADGLRKVWTLIKEKFVRKEEGKGLSSNDFTDDDKTKLDGIEDGAEKNPTAYLKAVKFRDKSSNTIVQIGNNTDKLLFLEGGNGIDLHSGFSSGQHSIVIENTIDAQDFDEATTTEAGLMSASDKAKLDGIESGADVNIIENITYNGTPLEPDSDKNVDLVAFEGIQAGTSGDIIYADEVDDAVLKIVPGENISIAKDTIGGKGVLKISGPAPGESYTVATPTANGLMSKEDKAKLDDIEDGAEVNAITKIKVNGSNQSISSRTVNLTIPTTESIQSQIDTSLVGVYVYAGSVATASALPSNLNSTTDVGKVYNIEADSDYGLAGTNVAWNGSEWDALGISFKIEAMTDTEIQNIYDSVFGA